jgi:hypothetical protein
MKRSQHLEICGPACATRTRLSSYPYVMYVHHQPRNLCRCSCIAGATAVVGEAAPTCHVLPLLCHIQVQTVHGRSTAGSGAESQGQWSAACLARAGMSGQPCRLDCHHCNRRCLTISGSVAARLGPEAGVEDGDVAQVAVVDLQPGGLVALLDRWLAHVWTFALKHRLLPAAGPAAVPAETLIKQRRRPHEACHLCMTPRSVTAGEPPLATAGRHASVLQCSRARPR